MEEKSLGKELRKKKEDEESEKIWESALERGFEEVLRELYKKRNREYVEEFREFVE
jgi:hypothetical protein